LTWLGTKWQWSSYHKSSVVKALIGAKAWWASLVESLVDPHGACLDAFDQGAVAAETSACLLEEGCPSCVRLITSWDLRAFVVAVDFVVDACCRGTCYPVAWGVHPPFG
jgi:hypothetical protein